MTEIKTHNLGYPRIGENRELKKATEAYWKGQLQLEELLGVGKSIREANWRKQQASGIDLIPVNDFSFYDHVLDMSCMVGNIPPRFLWKGGLTNLNTVFSVARGVTVAQHSDSNSCGCGGVDVKTSTYASEMTKWFDTNYHYIVPEFREDTRFALSSHKLFEEFAEAKALGIQAKPVLLGPVTYLSLGKAQDQKHQALDPLDLLDGLLDVYEQIIRRLAAEGAVWIQFDEPIFSLDLNEKQHAALLKSYERLSRVKGNSKLLIATYFGALRENLDLYFNLPVDALHVDLVRGLEDLDTIIAKFPEDKILSAGVVEGRNVWKNRHDASLKILESLSNVIGAERLWVAPSCSLIHSPVSLAHEKQLNPEIRNWLAFADEKLVEVVDLRNLLVGKSDIQILENNRQSAELRRKSSRIHHARVKERLSKISEEDFLRGSKFEIRQQKQAAKLILPEFPTTTIGSFPQTAEIRKARAKWKKGEIQNEEYESYLRTETEKCVIWQEEVGIDVLVHGEFERNDMVEYFGEYLEGFAFTENGWVQSYGSRYVKPPIIFGDVSRPKSMTVDWTKYAQSLTKKPVKGMLTGPVTILQWSFVRDDQPRSITAQQIALAIRDEVLDLEKEGIAIVQIDEPAIREGLPLRRSDWSDYLKWAVNSFRLSAAGVKDETQIHTHMCYSEFNDIIQAVADLDADVITIETSRSNMELLEAFVDFRYPNEIGPGVYDIHSPRVPTVEEMVNLICKAASVLPKRNLWINPDCGLKTRGWDEVKPALINMVEAAKRLRTMHF